MLLIMSYEIRVIFNRENLCSLDLALSVASEFGLSQGDARAIAKKIGDVVSGWRLVAKEFHIKNAEVERMSSAFDHNDLVQAFKLT